MRGIVRQAILTDTFCAVEMLRAFHGVWLDQVGSRIDGCDGASLAFDAERAQRIFQGHLRGGFACALILVVDDAPRGLLLASAFEHGFAPLWIAKETAWWVEPKYRGPSAIRMLDAYEDWARSRRCVFAGMAGMGEDPDVAALYRRRGYRGAETHYLKAL